MKETFSLRLFFTIYQLIWSFLTPFLSHFGRLKEGSDERTLNVINFSKVDLWIHAASAGEAYLARQIVKNLGGEQNYDILMTTNTLQGKEILKNTLEEFEHRITVSYMVFDNPSLIHRAVKIADPELLVLIELEIWPALMAEIKKDHKRIIIVNGRMTEKSFNNYMKIRWLWRKLKPDTILAISEADKARFTALFNLQSTYHVANIKFDLMQRCRIIEREHTREKFLVLASIRKEEEKQVLYLIEKILEKFPDLQIALFPRHLHRVKNWVEMLSVKNISWSLKTSNSQNDFCSVVIWDIFGQLTRIYVQADAVFVGGSLAPLGGQNFIEAFMNGVIPVTGPWVSDFLWAGEEVFQKDLVRKGNTKEEVLQLLLELLQNPVDKTLIQKKADHYIGTKQGGTTMTCQHISALMNGNNKTV